jgi:hypothetical protein
MARVGYTVLALRFFGDDLNPEEISARLGSSPTNAASKGDVTNSPNGTRVAKTGKWILSVEAHTAVADLDSLINQLFQNLTPDLETWRELSSRFSGNLFVGLFLGTGNEGADIASQTLTGIAARRLALGLDIYDRGASRTTAG